MAPSSLQPTMLSTPRPADGNNAPAALSKARGVNDSPRDAIPGAIITVAAFLTAALVLASTAADPDLWGHVLYGTELLHEGLPETTTWSFTAEGYRWINHENLAEIAMAWSYAQFGTYGLTVGKLLLSLLLLGLLYHHLRAAGTGLTLAGITLWVVAENAEFHWHFRPQIFGYVCFALLLSLLSSCFRNWQFHWWVRGCGPACALDEGPRYESSRIRRLWLLVPLFAVWANTHGSFAAGLAITLVYLVLRSFEAWLWWGDAARGRLKRFALMGLGAMLGSLLTPYGPNLHAWLLESVGQPRPEIGDWQPIDLVFGDSPQVWLLLIPLGLCTWRRRTSGDMTHTILLWILCWQALSHIRHLPLFAIACGFWLPPQLQLMANRLNSEMARGDEPAGTPSPLLSQSVAGMAGVWSVLAAAMLIPRLQAIEVNRAKYPVDALAYFTDQGLSGRCVVTFNWAQYAIYAFAKVSPESRVAFDGRFRTCYPQPIIDLYFDFLFGTEGSSRRHRSPNSPPPDAHRALAFREPDLVLVSRRQRPAIETMRAAREDWTLLYQDQLAQLWGRREKYDDPASPDYVPPASRQVSDQRLTGAVAWPAVQPIEPAPESDIRFEPVQLLTRLANE